MQESTQANDFVLEITEEQSITFIEICQKCNLKEEELQEMLEHGLFEDNGTKTVNLTTLKRIESAYRLQADLGVNIPGAALALELLDELQLLRSELDFLRKHLATA